MLTTPEMQVAIINNRDNKLSKDSKHHQINQRIIDWLGVKKKKKNWNKNLINKATTTTCQRERAGQEQTSSDKKHISATTLGKFSASWSQTKTRRGTLKQTTMNLYEDINKHNRFQHANHTQLSINTQQHQKKNT